MSSFGGWVLFLFLFLFCFLIIISFHYSFTVVCACSGLAFLFSFPVTAIQKEQKLFLSCYDLWEEMHDLSCSAPDCWGKADLVINGSVPERPSSSQNNISNF